MWCNDEFIGIVWLPTTIEPPDIQIIVVPSVSVDPASIAAAINDRHGAPPRPKDSTPEDAPEATGDEPAEPSLEDQPAMADGREVPEPNDHASRQETLLLAEDEAPGDDESNTGSAEFSVRCFGSFEVSASGRQISRWKVQKARELLAYLIARGDSPVLRWRRRYGRTATRLTYSISFRTQPTTFGGR